MGRFFSTARPFCLLIGGLAVVPAARGEPANPDLTLRARAVLRRYCGGCHNGGDKNRGEVSIMDSTGLERAGRPFLTPGVPDTSQVVRLMEDGSMPPGTHDKPSPDEIGVVKEWIRAAAPPYPKQFDDTYVLNAILQDVERLPEADRPKVRYFSLHNLIADEVPIAAITDARARLRQAIAGIAKPDFTPPAGVDPLELVFRVDLVNAGWRVMPFKELDPSQPNRELPAHVNLFDLVLIEYPFGSIDPSLPAHKKLTERFLKPADQLVPLAYIRGDWFADVFLKSSPVAKEMRDVLGLAQTAAPAAVSSRPVVREDGRGTPVLPFDATTQTDVKPRGLDLEILNFEVGLVPPRANRANDGFQRAKDFVPNKNFKSGDKWMIRFRCNKQAFVEFNLIDEEGKAWIVPLGTENMADPGEDEYYGYDKETSDGIPLEARRAGTLRLTVLTSEAQFPPGRHLISSNKQLNDRVVHPFYLLPGMKTKYEFDPAHVAKKTIEFTIKPK